MTTTIRPVRAAVAAVLGVTLGAPAMAQSASDVLEEVTVTATRREQNLQQVGIAVTAIGGDALKELAVNSTSELMNVTPGLRLQEGGGGPIIGLLSIRGVAQNDFAGHIEAPNAMYIDDVYQPGISSSIQQFYDVDRIEVLKGPQGTLFGRNATGGLIHIINKRPTDELEGFADVGYGTKNQIHAEAALSGPLAEGVSARLSILRNKADGYIENAIGPDLNEDDTSAARLQLQVKNDRLDALLSGSIYKISDINTGGAYATAGVPDAAGLGQPLPPGSPTLYGYVDADGDPWTGAFDNPGYLDRKQTDFSTRIAYTFENGTSLRWLGSYSKIDSKYEEDNDLSPVPFTNFRQNADTKYLTSELRLEGTGEGKRWTTGLYYLDADGDYLQGFDIVALGTTLESPYSLQTKSWSVFGQVEWDLTDTLTLTTGGRWTQDEKDYDYVHGCTGPACFLFDAPGTIGAAGRLTDSHDEGGWSGRLSLDYKPNENTLYYVSINRGYKAFNYNAGFAGFAPLSGLRFTGEKLLAYEIGTKLQFWGDRARFNAAAFYYDYKDYQAFDQRGLNFTLFNTDAKVHGADFELALRPGWGINLQLGAALLDTKVEDVPIGAQLLTREAPQSPHATFMGAASKDFDLGFGLLKVSFNGAYTGKNFSQLTNAPVTKIRPDFVLNGRIALASSDDKWELGVSAKNLLDRARVIYAFDITGAPTGLVENTVAPPRWITADFRYKF